MIAFTAGDLSRADGVGIIFSQGLPRSSDIQKIISVSLGCTQSAAQGFMAMADRALDVLVIGRTIIIVFFGC